MRKTIPCLASRSTIAIVLAATLCGAAIRTYQAWSASVIAKDGIVFVSMARSMEHDWRAGIPEVPHFSYSLLIKWAYPLVGPHVCGDDLIRWQRTAQAVSILFGTLCIPAVYWLGRYLVSRRVGLLAAWCWAFLPDAVRISADALSDMPCLAFMLWGLIATMIALRAHSIGHFVWAGVLSGAAYAIREEGGEVALIATILALVRCRVRIGWRLTAAMAVIAGFAVFGGSYIWIEGGSIFSKKPFLLVQTVVEPCRELFASCVGLTPGRSPMLAAADVRPLTVQLQDILHAPWTVLARETAISIHKLGLELCNSLNGVWLLLGIAYFFLPGRQRFRHGWRRAPLFLAVVHGIAAMLVYAKCGYLARRHVMLLDVLLVILAAGTLVWCARRLTMAVLNKQNLGSAIPVARSWQLILARRSDILIFLAIVMATLPWLLRDIGGNHGYVHDAAQWIQTQYPGRSDVRIVTDHTWIPFYARQKKWYATRTDTQTCPQLLDAELLILELPTTLPPVVDIPGRNERIQLTAAAKFSDSRGRRHTTIYRIERLVAASAPAK